MQYDEDCHNSKKMKKKMQSQLEFGSQYKLMRFYYASNMLEWI